MIFRSIIKATESSVLYLFFIFLIIYLFEWYTKYYTPTIIHDVLPTLILFAPAIIGVYILSICLDMGITVKKIALWFTILVAILCAINFLLIAGIISTIGCNGENCLALQIGFFSVIIFMDLFIPLLVVFVMHLITKKTIFRWILFIVFALLISLIAINIKKDGGCSVSDATCFGEKAFHANDKTICDRTNARARCITYLAHLKKDESLCNDTIGTHTEKEISNFNNCIENVVRAKMDKTICEKSIEYSQSYGYSTIKSCYQSYEWEVERLKKEIK